MRKKYEVSLCGEFLLCKICILHLLRVLPNAPERLKCITTGVCCKHSLAFHCVSCLSSLLVTVPQLLYNSHHVSFDRHAQEHVLRVESQLETKDVSHQRPLWDSSELESRTEDRGQRTEDKLLRPEPSCRSARGLLAGDTAA